MKINIPFRRKDSEIETSPCVVEKTVELSADWFDHFSQNLLNDYDFILENTDHMFQDNNGVNHCLLVLCEERDDGIPRVAPMPVTVPIFRVHENLYSRSNIRR